MAECGPGIGRCNKDIDEDSIYCNTENGWCGNTTAHRDAQPGDEYDWDSSCLGSIKFIHIVLRLTQNESCFSYTIIQIRGMIKTFS